MPRIQSHNDSRSPFRVVVPHLPITMVAEAVEHLSALRGAPSQEQVIAHVWEMIARDATRGLALAAAMDPTNPQFHN